jgi:hypothetical protein
MFILLKMSLFNSFSKYIFTGLVNLIDGYFSHLLEDVTLVFLDWRCGSSGRVSA